MATSKPSPRRLIELRQQDLPVAIVLRRHHGEVEVFELRPAREKCGMFTTKIEDAETRARLIAQRSDCLQ